ncbi:MAG: beta-lactamase family protein, partial [Opitutaceae bacterium]|nr:beta-lactamase family protein [Opitutaceae bacterium]
MRNSLRLSALFLTLALAPALRLPAGPFADTARPYVADGTLAGAVFLAANGDNILACEAVGLADIATGKPMRPDSLFWIASMTKPVTAAALMMLVDEGKISLDDPVSKYIPAFDAPQKIVPKASEKLSNVTNLTTAHPASSAAATAATNATASGTNAPAPATAPANAAPTVRQRAITI